MIEVGQSADRRAPGPHGSFLLGCLKAFQNDTIGFLDAAAKEYGDIVRFRLGHVVVHLLNHPELAREVLIKSRDHFDKRTRSVAKIRATCGESLLSSEGQQWQLHRQAIQPAFQERSLSALAGNVRELTEAMLACWERSAEKDEPVDMVSEMLRLTLKVAAKTLFHCDLESELLVIEQALADVLDDTWRRLESPWDWSVLNSRFHSRKFRNAIQAIDNVVYTIIRDRKRANARNDDLLSRIIDLQAIGSARNSNQEVRDAVLTLLLAGHETTANALSWSFYLISRSPGVGARFESLHNNQAESLGHRIEYARQVFYETIRLYPSIWIMERRVAKPTTIQGVRLPARSSVVISPYLLHRHPEFWSSPEQFQPDRFQESTPGLQEGYLPFGAGPHRCIGEPMALLVGSHVIEAATARFQFYLEDQEPIRALPGITLRHASPLRMKIVSRSALRPVSVRA